MKRILVCIVSTFLIHIYAANLTAQCVQQPRPALEYRGFDGQMTTASMWACKGESYEAAWDLLVANNVAPIRGITVAELAGKINRKSRKTVIMTTLEWVGYFAPMVALQLPPSTSDLAKGLIAGLPQAAAKGIELFRGYPEDFVLTPSEGGFVTVYSLASNELIIPRGTGSGAGSAGERVPGLTTPAGTINGWLRELHDDNDAENLTSALNFNDGVTKQTPMSGDAQPSGGAKPHQKNYMNEAEREREILSLIVPLEVR